MTIILGILSCLAFFQAGYILGRWWTERRYAEAIRNMFVPADSLPPLPVDQRDDFSEGSN